MSITALTTDGRFPVPRKRPTRPSVDNAFLGSWCPHFGVRFTLRIMVPSGATAACARASNAYAVSQGRNISMPMDTTQ